MSKQPKIKHQPCEHVAKGARILAELAVHSDSSVKVIQSCEQTMCLQKVVMAIQATLPPVLVVTK